MASIAGVKRDGEAGERDRQADQIEPTIGYSGPYRSLQNHV
jgi:hypothetical protein